MHIALPPVRSWVVQIPPRLRPDGPAWRPAARACRRRPADDACNCLSGVRAVAGDLARAAGRARRLLARAARAGAAARGARRGRCRRLAGRRRGGAGAQRGRRDRAGGDVAARAGLPGRVPSDHRRRPQRRRHRRRRPRRRAGDQPRGAPHGVEREAAAVRLVGQGVGAVAGHRRGAHARPAGRLSAADGRRHRPSARRGRAARHACAGRAARSGVADGAAALRFVLGEGADPGVRVLLREALSVLVDQRSAQPDGRRRGRLHAGQAQRARGGGRHRIDSRRADRRLQPRRADQASRQRPASDPARSGRAQRVAAPVRQLARHLEHDRAHRVHAAPLFAAAARGHAARDDDHLPRAARGRARIRRARVAGMARVGVDVHRVCADAALLPALAAVGAGAAAGRAVLRRCDVRVRMALLARQGRAVEGARAGAGGALNGGHARRPVAGSSHSKKPDRRAADRALSFGAP
ncbi:hypothetical protein BVI434_2710023 [Burkholderia vietnamiensis]|nr:hypothetical protein BVI434_2710023 [Burkholderia vietnamiensis]